MRERKREREGGRERDEAFFFSQMLIPNYLTVQHQFLEFSGEIACVRVYRIRMLKKNKQNKLAWSDDYRHSYWRL